MQHALKHFLLLDCENPRDHIYGILALVVSTQRIGIDYSRPANMVFWDVMAIATKDWDSDWLISLGRKMSVKGTESNAMELR
jgi:hypothetical protein